MTPTIYLDMDGVLADFDRGAQHQLGVDSTYKFEFIHGTAAFWKGLNADAHFFANLQPMPDMERLLDAVQHCKLAVLTALPSSDADSVRNQKQEWVENWVEPYVGRAVPVICCMTKDKPNYCCAGDVLIDDRAVNRDKWKSVGGRFIVHTSAISTIYQLNDIGAI